jgi:hypothetical protein
MSKHFLVSGNNFGNCSFKGGQNGHIYEFCRFPQHQKRKLLEWGKNVMSLNQNQLVGSEFSNSKYKTIEKQSCKTVVSRRCY